MERDVEETKIKPKDYGSRQENKTKIENYGSILSKSLSLLSLQFIQFREFNVSFLQTHCQQHPPLPLKLFFISFAFARSFAFFFFCTSLEQLNGALLKHSLAH